MAAPAPVTTAPAAPTPVNDLTVGQLPSWFPWAALAVSMGLSFAIFAIFGSFSDFFIAFFTGGRNGFSQHRIVRLCSL